MLRKPLAVVVVTAVVLAAAGLALAHGGAPNSLQAASATFDATTVSRLKSSSCTGSDGSYTRTRATYSGTATSDDGRLNGQLVVRALSVYNTDTKLGYVMGRYVVSNDSGKTLGWFQAVDTDGSVSGFTNGLSRSPRAWMLGTLSASFDPAAGFSDGQLGAGSSDGAAVFASGHCGDTPAPAADVSVFSTSTKQGSTHHKKRRHGQR
jgi:hypothetical protein